MPEGTEGKGEEGKGNGNGGDEKKAEFVPKADFDALKEGNEKLAKTVTQLQQTLVSPEFLNFQESQREPKPKAKEKEPEGKEVTDDDLDTMSGSKLFKLTMENIETLVNGAVEKLEGRIDKNEATRSVKSAKAEIKELIGTPEKPGLHPDFMEYTREMGVITRDYPGITPKRAIILAKQLRAENDGKPLVIGGKKEPSKEEEKEATLAEGEKPGSGLGGKGKKVYPDTPAGEAEAYGDVWDETMGKKK